LSSIEPNNPDDIVTELISRTNAEGFYFEYTLKTTEALMDICGTVKVIFTERFRESVKTEAEWQTLIEDELSTLVAVETANARIRLYDPNADTEYCPSGWQTGIDSSVTDDCYPDDVRITCFPNQMLVSFPANAVYRDADRLFQGVQLNAGFVNSNCQITMSTDKFYLSGSYDDCGFTATHENGQLIFSHEITGIQSNNLITDNIYTSEVLSFPVSCSYADSSSISNLAFVGYNPIRGSVDKYEGDFNFELKAYKDPGRLQLITSQSGIDLGEIVYNSIRPVGPLANSIDYQITECTAFEQIADVAGQLTGQGLAYDLIKDSFCAADLVDVTLDAFNDFSFKSFTFQPTDETLALICQIRICLSSETTCLAVTDNLTCPSKYSI